MKKALELLENPPGALPRRDFLKLSAAVLLPSFLSACAKGPKKKELNFFNWSNYIGKNTIPEFEKETGIQVDYDMFSDEDEMLAKLRTGVRGYDLLVADDYQIPKLRALRLIDPIPEGAIKGYDNLGKRFRNPPYDPGLRYTLPYLWGTTGLGYNKKYISKPPDSWWDLWNPDYKGKIDMLDNVRDGIGAALLALGLPTETGDPGDLKRAVDLLVQQRPLLKHYTSNTYIDELVSGEAWIAEGWSGDVLQAIRENPTIDYVIPKEGSFIYVSSLVLPSGSEHREEALAFMNFSLKPKVAADVSNTTHYPTPVEAAMPYLDPDLASDQRVFPGPEILKRLRFYGTLPPDTEDAWDEAWQDVKVAT